MRVAVVPTIRPALLARQLPPWQRQGGWDRLIVIEDAPEPTLPGAYAWREIDAMLGEDAWIISRQDSAIRSFGFLLAWRMGAELVATFDDDCLPLDDDWMGRHAAVLSRSPRWESSAPGLRVRGMPYRELGQCDRARINVGLWTGVPDLDGPCGLVSPMEGYQPPRGSRMAAAGRYVPMCGMNLAFTREALPLMWFPLMGRSQPYRRFDDIWCGVVAKRICDHLGWGMSFGEPFLHHTRASNALGNLQAEAAGIALNEVLWQLVEEVKLTASTAEGCFLEVAEAFAASGNPYLHQNGKAMRRWIARISS